MIHDNKRRQMRRFLAPLDTQGSRLKNKRKFARPYPRWGGGSAADCETKGAIIVVGPRGRGIEGGRGRNKLGRSSGTLIRNRFCGRLMVAPPSGLLPDQTTLRKRREEEGRGEERRSRGNACRSDTEGGISDNGVITRRLTRE